ncbi:hypothetical protein MnTg02_03109 [bacterium MnTg02]|nr:hypothetical protein MnTg02_03109 [bacterium MnTg02]
MDDWQGRPRGPRLMAREPAWRLNAHWSLEMTHRIRRSRLGLFSSSGRGMAHYCCEPLEPIVFDADLIEMTQRIDQIVEIGTSTAKTCAHPVSLAMERLGSDILAMRSVNKIANGSDLTARTIEQFHRARHLAIHIIRLLARPEIDKRFSFATRRNAERNSVACAASI